MSADPMERFYSRVVAGPGGCHLWTASTRSTGYGQFYADGRRWSSHRWIYAQVRGPIPDGLVLDHVVCDTSTCVNPYHVEPRSQSANVLRGSGPTAVNARKAACAKGHPYNDQTYIDPRGRRRCRPCKQEWDRNHD